MAYGSPLGNGLSSKPCFCAMEINTRASLTQAKSLASVFVSSTKIAPLLLSTQFNGNRRPDNVSMKIPRGQLHVAEQVAEVVQIAGDQMLHPVHALPAAAYG